MKTDKFFGTSFVLLVAIVLISFLICAPFAFIWALNQLFNLGITYSLKNLAASFVLVVLCFRPFQ